MKRADLDQSDVWSRVPLCSRYRLVRFVEQQVGLRAGTAWYDWRLTWALGTLGEGRPHPLGVWQHSVVGGLDWQAVFHDLAARGVERIDFAVNADARAGQATFPRLTTLSIAMPERRDLVSIERRSTGSASTLGAGELQRRARVLLRTTEEAVQQLHRGLCRVAARCGPFESAQAAAAFAMAWLENAERREHRRRLAAEHRAAVAAAVVMPPAGRPAGGNHV